MKCCICQKKLNGFEDCQERWDNGSRIIICKKEECNKKYTQLGREKYMGKDKKG